VEPERVAADAEAGRLRGHGRAHGGRA